jgi:hypothetical protein
MLHGKFRLRWSLEQRLLVLLAWAGRRKAEGIRELVISHHVLVLYCTSFSSSFRILLTRQNGAFADCRDEKRAVAEYSSTSSLHKKHERTQHILKIRLCLFSRSPLPFRCPSISLSSSMCCLASPSSTRESTVVAPMMMKRDAVEASVGPLPFSFQKSCLIER